MSKEVQEEKEQVIDVEKPSDYEEMKEENKEEVKKVSRPFDPEKDSKSWGDIDLGFMLV